MFIVREYAACAIMVCMLGTLLLALCGIGYLLKSTGARFTRMLHAAADRMPRLKLDSKDVTDSGSESSAVADYSL